VVDTVDTPFRVSTCIPPASWEDCDGKGKGVMDTVSRRDYFAVSALRALIEKNGKAWDSDGLFDFDSMENTHSVVDWEDVIMMAIDLADRMIGELDG